MYNCIFLDLDGTVLDFSQSERHAFFCTMEHMGIPVTEEDLARYHEINAAFWLALERGEVSDRDFRPKRFEKLLAARGTWDWEAINASYVTNLARFGIPFPGAIELVGALHEKYTICVLTNGSLHSQTGRLQKSGLAPYIDFMITSEEVGEPKPSPKMFFEAMKRRNDLDVAHYIMLGDSLSADIAGAINAGVDSILYAPQGVRERTTPLPTFRAKSYADVRLLLLGNTD